MVVLRILTLQLLQKNILKSTRIDEKKTKNQDGLSKLLRNIHSVKKLDVDAA